MIYAAGATFSPELTIQLLKPFIETAVYPKNLMAVHMMQTAIDYMNRDLCIQLLSGILNSLRIVWRSKHSDLREAAGNCLVSLTVRSGRPLIPILN